MWYHLVLRLQGKLRVSLTSAHFHDLSLPNWATALSPPDPQHLRSMAVFSDTAKRLWGLYLFTRCSRPRDSPLERGGIGCSSNSIYHSCCGRNSSIPTAFSIVRLRGTYYVKKRKESLLTLNPTWVTH